MGESSRNKNDETNHHETKKNHLMFHQEPLGMPRSGYTPQNPCRHDPNVMPQRPAPEFIPISVAREQGKPSCSTTKILLIVLVVGVLIAGGVITFLVFNSNKNDSKPGKTEVESGKVSSPQPNQVSQRPPAKVVYFGDQQNQPTGSAVTTDSPAAGIPGAAQAQPTAQKSSCGWLTWLTSCCGGCLQRLGNCMTLCCCNSQNMSQGAQATSAHGPSRDAHTGRLGSHPRVSAQNSHGTRTQKFTSSHSSQRSSAGNTAFSFHSSQRSSAGKSQKKVPENKVPEVRIPPVMNNGRVGYNYVPPTYVPPTYVPPTYVPPTYVPPTTSYPNYGRPNRTTRTLPGLGRKSCPKCKGMKALNKSGSACTPTDRNFERFCKVCHGSGEVSSQDFYIQCMECFGKGAKRDGMPVLPWDNTSMCFGQTTDCSKCRGSGMTRM